MLWAWFFSTYAFEHGLVFCIAHALFEGYFWRKRSHMELYFVEWMDDTMLTSSVEAKQGDMVCTWILITKAWREFSQV
jgi:hypothetical protein